MMNTSESPKPGSIVCIFCRCVVNYFHGDKEKFLQHLRYEHSIQFFEQLMLAINLTNRTNLDIIIDVFGGEKEGTKVVSKDELLKRVRGEQLQSKSHVEPGNQRTELMSEKKKGRPSKKIGVKDKSDSSTSVDPIGSRIVNKVSTSDSSPALKASQSGNTSLVISSKKEAPKVTENKIISTKITQNAAIPADNILHTRSRSRSQSHGGNVGSNGTFPNSKSQPNSNTSRDIKIQKPTILSNKSRKNIIAEHKNLPQRGFVKKSVIIHKKDSLSAPRNPTSAENESGKFLKCFYKNKMFPLNSLRKAYVKLNKTELKTAQNNLGSKKNNKLPTPTLDDNIIVIEDDQEDCSVNLNQSILDLDSSMNNSLLQKILKSNNISFVKNPHEAQKDDNSGVEIIKTVQKIQRNPLPPKKELLTLDNLSTANKKQAESEDCTFCILCDKSYDHVGLSKKMFLRKHMSEKHDARISSAPTKSAEEQPLSNANGGEQTNPENVSLDTSTPVTDEVQKNVSTPKSGNDSLTTATAVNKQALMNTPITSTKSGPLTAATPVDKKVPLNIDMYVKENGLLNEPKSKSKPSKPDKLSKTKELNTKNDTKIRKPGSGRKRKNSGKVVESKKTVPESGVSSAKAESSTLTQNATLPSETDISPEKSIKTEKVIDQSQSQKVANKRKRRPSEILNFKLNNSEKIPNERTDAEKAPADIGPSAEKLMTKINQMNKEYPKQKVVTERNENPSTNLFVPTVKFENLTLQTPKPKSDLERNIENLVSNHISTDLLSQSLGHQVIIERKRRNPDVAVTPDGNTASTEAMIAETSKSMIQETQQMLKHSDKLIEEYNRSFNSPVIMTVNSPVSNNAANVSVKTAMNMSDNRASNISVVKAAPNINSIKSEFTKEGLGKVSDYFKYNPNLVHPVGNQASQFCSVDESLPKGWKVRIVKSGSRIEKEFLSPEDLVLKSRKAVEEYINILSKY